MTSFKMTTSTALIHIMFHIDLALLIMYHSMLGEAHPNYHIQLVEMIYHIHVIAFYVKCV